MPHDFGLLRCAAPGGKQARAGQFIEQIGELLGCLRALVRQEVHVGTAGAVGAGVRGHRERGELDGTGQRRRRGPGERKM